MRARSKKRTRDDVTRREMRLAFLERNSHCEMCRQQPAIDVDELIGRGVLPGAQLIEQLFQALCRTCHRLKTEHPDWAYRHGWSAHVWDLDRVDEIKSRRARCPLTCETDHVSSPS